MKEGRWVTTCKQCQQSFCMKHGNVPNGSQTSRTQVGVGKPFTRQEQNRSMPTHYDSPQSHTDTNEVEDHGGREGSSNEPSFNAACVRPHSRPSTTVLNERQQGQVITAATHANMTEQRGDVAAYDSTTAINCGRGTLQDA